MTKNIESHNLHFQAYLSSNYSLQNFLTETLVSKYCRFMHFCILCITKLSNDDDNDDDHDDDDYYNKKK